jgi:hypothetical protein
LLLANDPPEVRAPRIAAAIVDYCWIVGVYCIVSSVIFQALRWSALTHLGIPLLIYPFYSYLSFRFLGATPAQFLLGLRSRVRGDAKKLRIYDWLFHIRLRLVGNARSNAMLIAFPIAATVFAFGASGLFWGRDPTVRPYGTRMTSLYAPDLNEAKNWDTLPYFYTTGVFPRPNHPAFTNVGGMEYSLPYEKGPPNRFLGKVVAYWRDLDSRLILSGPLTASGPSTPDELRECVSGWLRCKSERRKIWKHSIRGYFDDRDVAVNEWFEVENGFIPKEERPRGIYLRSKVEGGRLREAYFVVGPKMAVQGFILDRPDREEGQRASDLLAKTIGSLRVSSDLQAPRAFVDPKIAGLRLTAKSTLNDLIAAEAVLLAKVTIEPKQSETFYHLAGLGVTLFRTAKREGRIELAATSKVVVNNALQYVRDVDSKSPRIPEMERFVAEVEAN